MIFVKSFTQARFQPIWKFTPIKRKPRHVLSPKTPYKSKQMCDSPTVLLRYALSLLYNIKLIKNYTKIFEITQDMSSPAEILPNVEIIYTSAACDACDKYHVCSGHVPSSLWSNVSKITSLWDRHDICHKHHKQRLCKIISTRVKFYFVNVFLEHGCVYHFGFW